MKNGRAEYVHAVVAGTIWPCMVWTTYLALHRKYWEGENPGEDHWMSQTRDVPRHIFCSWWVLNPVVSPVNPRDLLGSQRVRLDWSDLAHAGQKEWTPLKAAWKVKVLVAQPCPTLWDPVSCSSSVHGILQARILEWGSHFLLQGISLTQGLNPDLQQAGCRQILYHLSHPGSVVQKQLNHVQNCQR